MAKSEKPTTEELLAQIESLKSELAIEKKINRKVLGLPEDTPADKISAPWSTEWMQEQVDECEVIGGAVTQAYDQRLFKLLWTKNGNVFIRQHNGEQARNWRKKYKRMKINLNANSFYMLLELMQFAAREFGSNRDEVISALTEGKGIKVKRTIVDF